MNISVEIVLDNNLCPVETARGIRFDVFRAIYQEALLSGDAQLTNQRVLVTNTWPLATSSATDGNIVIYIGTSSSQPCSGIICSTSDEIHTRLSDALASR